MIEWRCIDGYIGKYMISENGDVKSIKRIVSNKGTKSRHMTVNEKILKPCKTGKKRNYLSVNLSLNGKLKMYKIHYLVYVAFFGDIKKGLVINHKDSNTFNNHYKNLEIITNRDNVNHYQKTNKNKTSKYIGVSFCKKTGKWFACGSKKRKTKYLGRYNTEEEAHIAYLAYLESINEIPLYC